MSHQRSEATIGVFCGSCGAMLVESPGAPIESRIVCSCGSLGRHFKCDIVAEIRIHASMRARQKRLGMRGWLVEMIVGKEPHKGPHGVFIEWVNKYRRIDKPADRYIERVVTEAGEILRDVDEPLGSHLGHGSDKPKLRLARLAEKAN